jgi:hypothetical protein
MKNGVREKRDESSIAHLPQRHTLVSRLSHLEIVLDRLDHLGFARGEVFKRHEPALGLDELYDF